MNDIEEFINNGDYFFCERYKAGIKRDVCLARQMRAKKRKENPHARFQSYDPGCADCEQGRGLMVEGEYFCECGKPATCPHNAKVPRWCNDCWGKKLKEGIKAGQSKKKRWTLDIVYSDIVFDVRQYPKMYELVKEEANKEFRSVEKEILFLLSRHFGVEGKDQCR